MYLYCIFFAFIFRGIYKNKKIYMMEIPEYIENIENEFLVEMKKIKMAKHGGRDERYPDDKIDEELLNKITQNSIKMELLHDLQNSKISIFDKVLLLELNKDFFIEPDVTFNITAGGLLDHF
jgi:hypothetical protein